MDLDQDRVIKTIEKEYGKYAVEMFFGLKAVYLVGESDPICVGHEVAKKIGYGCIYKGIPGVEHDQGFSCCDCADCDAADWIIAHAEHDLELHYKSLCVREGGND